MINYKLHTQGHLVCDANYCFCHFHNNFLVYAGKISRITYGRGTGPILMEYVHCSGFEESLLDCDHNGLGLSTCGHWEDAGVVCQGEMFCINTHH